MESGNCRPTLSGGFFLIADAMGDATDADLLH
jgi:hypothetical protein